MGLPRKAVALYKWLWWRVLAARGMWRGCISQMFQTGIGRAEWKIHWIISWWVFFKGFIDSYVQYRLEISPIHVHIMRYKKDVRKQPLCPVCKNEINDEAHVLFRCNAYDELRKDVSIITNTNQDDSIALSRVMAPTNLSFTGGFHAFCNLSTA